jgi:hypothetical protein
VPAQNRNISSYINKYTKNDFIKESKRLILANKENI